MTLLIVLLHNYFAKTLSNDTNIINGTEEEKRAISLKFLG